MGLEATQYFLFLTASLVLILTPGPDMIYIISRAVSQGRKAGLFSALGVCAGLIIHTIAVALGLAVLLQTSSVAFYTVEYLGAAYLVYLGFKNLTAKQGIKVSEVDEQRPYGSLFLQGFLTDVLNPKVALFFISFLPQFVNHKSGIAALQMIILGLSYFLLSILILCLIAMLSGKIGNWLKKTENASMRVTKASGGILVGLGISIAMPEIK